MNPLDPVEAHQIVIEYARILEQDIAENRYPAPIDTLPFAVSAIKTAIRTSVTALARTGQLTGELRDYFETAYVSLADYLDPELATAAPECRGAADDITALGGARAPATERLVWRNVVKTSALAADIARATAAEADKLRREFEQFSPIATARTVTRTRRSP